MDAKFSVVITTTPDRAEADRLAHLLLSQRLAACVQVSQIASHYTWNGEMQVTNEQMILIKCPSINFDRIEQCIKANHSYDLPEIVQLPIATGSVEYLKWITDSTQ